MAVIRDRLEVWSELCESYRNYRKDDTMDNFKAHMALFDEFCGVTGFSDVAVIELLRRAANA